MKTFQAYGAIGMKPNLDTSVPHRRRPTPAHRADVADGDSQLALWLLRSLLAEAEQVGERPAARSEAEQGRRLRGVLVPTCKPQPATGQLGQR